MTTKESIKKIQTRISINNFSTYAILVLELLMAHQSLTLLPDSQLLVIFVILEALFITKNIKEKEELLKRLEELLLIESQENKLSKLENKDDTHKLKLK